MTVVVTSGLSCSTPGARLLLAMPPRKAVWHDAISLYTNGKAEFRRIMLRAGSVDLPSGAWT
jgi:hypothetical protein